MTLTPLIDHNLTKITEGTNLSSIVNVYDSEDRAIKQTRGNHTIDVNYVLDHAETEVTETIRDENGVNPYQIIKTYRFNAQGYTDEEVDAEGNLIRNILNSHNLVIRKEVWSAENSEGDRSLIKTRNYTYDAAGQKLTETATLDDESSITRTWTYDHTWIASESVSSSANPGVVFKTEYAFNYNTDGKPINIKEEKRLKADRSIGSESLILAPLNHLKYKTTNHIRPQACSISLPRLFQRAAALNSSLCFYLNVGGIEL